ncbi:MAG: HEAT repeat domain-containing protein [Spirochaetaceae bacterium]|nr:MAG: HEAT repeat domain-containing protein [Spirochaetaceae bacterium]
MKRFVVIIALVAVFGGLVFAQQDAAEDRRQYTIEELYLSQDVELQIIRSQARSEDREMKLLALQSIRSMIQSGALTEDNPSLFIVLESLATEGTGRRVISGGSRIENDYPDIRREAAGLLGEIGGEQSKRVLLGILRDDPEPMVLSEAVYALGLIGMNDENEVTTQVARVLGRQNIQLAPDNNLAFASLLAIEKLAVATGGISDPAVIDALLGVTSGNYMREVRLKAIDVISKLRGRT